MRTVSYKKEHLQNKKELLEVKHDRILKVNISIGRWNWATLSVGQKDRENKQKQMIRLIQNI